ncbi:DNA-directed RNA polymerase I subunit RPA49 isoform X1 [Conger conger]|uniref:DNA-directed RNA polymerase I subunit RPA49 isoform X1 n=1 Tax=Conger conger TaxID=82655 RepID=UPI002A5A2313|nr:DNA-directed RNA polymerase I subunit RPA49 isoform X1 [Conger conger]
MAEAEACIWKCCEEESEGNNAVIVQFSNGNLKNPDDVDFTLYKNVDGSNPRKKNRRILVAETDRLCYVGNNFGAGSLKCNTLCKYYVGVLDKSTREMEVHNAQIFNMQPHIPGESTPEEELPTSSKSYRDKVDSLIEAFGTNKQKRALSSRKLNQVGSDSLQQAVHRAANTIIDQKGLEALEQDVAQAEVQADTVLYLPPCHPDADQPQDVYPFDELISPVEYKALEAPGRKLLELTPEDLEKMAKEDSPLSVLKLLRTLSGDEESRDRQARCTWYLSLLIKLAHQRNFTRKFGQEEGCPRIIQNKLMRTFTVEAFNHGRIQNMLPTSMRVKLAAYCLALLLHLGEQMADLTLLHRDLRITENKMLEVAKSMGLKLSRRPVSEEGGLGPENEHRLATLELPLAKYDHLVQRRKRKKMK